MVAAEAADDAGGATKNELVGSRMSTVASAASSSLRIVEIMISGRVPPVVVEAFLFLCLVEVAVAVYAGLRLRRAKRRVGEIVCKRRRDVCQCARAVGCGYL